MEIKYVWRVVTDDDSEWWVATVEEIAPSFGDAVTSITRYSLQEETAIDLITLEPFDGN